MSKQIKSYRDLIAWQKAIAMVTDIYSLSSSISSSEKFGLISQLNRAAVSVPANIAEGWGRESAKSFVQFLRIAKGSLMEIETLLEIARNTNHIAEADYTGLLKQTTELNKIIKGLINSIVVTDSVSEEKMAYVISGQVGSDALY